MVYTDSAKNDTPNKAHLSVKDTWFCTILIHYYVPTNKGNVPKGHLIKRLPLLLGHSTVDADGWEVLLHQQLRQSHAPLY